MWWDTVWVQLEGWHWESNKVLRQSLLYLAWIWMRGEGCRDAVIRKTQGKQFTTQLKENKSFTCLKKKQLAKPQNHNHWWVDKITPSKMPRHKEVRHRLAWCENEEAMYKSSHFLFSDNINLRLWLLLSSSLLDHHKVKMDHLDGYQHEVQKTGTVMEGGYISVLHKGLLHFCDFSSNTENCTDI